MKKQLLCIISALLLSCGANAQMVLKFDTNFSDGTTITLPLYGTVNVTIDWGDTKSNAYTTEGSHEHTYAAEGIYTVSISGALTQFGNAWTPTPNMDKLTSVSSFGELGLTSLTGAFQDASNLTVVPASLPATVTDLSFLFLRATSFDQNIDGWNVSNVTDMSSMFREASSFNGNIGGWNVGKVTSMDRMFYEAHEFNQNIGGWNVSEVVDMGRMFLGAWEFNQNIGSWNVGKVTSMLNMLREAYAFNQDISSWNVSSVTDMSGLFYRALLFNQDISGWNVSSVTQMGWMFCEAHAFNQDISSWDVSNVFDMQNMFDKASLFNQDISSWNVDKVTQMRNMFYEAIAFDQDLSPWNVTNVFTMNSMFEGVTLSTANYDKMLIAWAAQSVRENVNFNGGDSKYSPGAAADARAVLAETYSWNISDGGETDFTAVNATFEDNFDVYPNPFRDRIQLSNAQEAHRAVISTIAGKVLMDVHLNMGTKQTIDTNLPSGIYFLTLTAKDGSKVLRKIIRE